MISQKRSVMRCLGGKRPLIDAASMLWFPGADGWFGPPGADRYVFSRLIAERPRPVHVLMIEDDPSIADMYSVQLEHDGYRVTVATTGELAFSAITGSTPDIVLLDLLLPDRSGFEVLAMLNERLPSHPPVVILSNYGEPSMIDRGRALGAIEYLVKSRVTPADVANQIPRWLEQARGGGPTES